MTSKYRADIDGLRALSVLAVIAYHSGIETFAGGFVGVDVFFVISGFLITSMVYDEVKTGAFSFVNFYVRRIFRLFPVLILTLIVVLVYGFLFYDEESFDELGKEVFFSSVGAANLLFGQGVNYFAQDESSKPLLHLWSLGVEEQFYLVWPTVLVLINSLSLRIAFLVLTFLSLVSLSLSAACVVSFPVKAYFFPQYRAFELIWGALAALGMKSQTYRGMKITDRLREIIILLALSLIILPIFGFNKTSIFPGFNALFPCAGTALFIVFSTNSTTAKVFTCRSMLNIGMMSYPMYLYHLPIISFVKHHGITDNNLFIFILTLSATIFLSLITHKYLEMPIRKTHLGGVLIPRLVYLLVFGLILVGGVGLFVAKTDGFPKRFELLNSFALQVSEKRAFTFNKMFKHGYNYLPSGKRRILFIGDSLAQQYVAPVAKALQIKVSDIDTVTSGGCVLLKGVDFKTKYADMAWEDLYRKLYKIDQNYDFIIMTQNWDDYLASVKNWDEFDVQNPLARWEPFIKETIRHFQPHSKTIFLIGLHVKVENTTRLKPHIFLSSRQYRKGLDLLKVANQNELEKSREFFDRFASGTSVFILHPADLFTDDDEHFCLQDGQWSCFRDTIHFSDAGTNHVTRKLDGLLRKNGFTSGNPRK